MIHPTVKPLTTCLAAVALLAACQQAPQRPEPYSWEADLRHRIALDFGRSEAEVKAYIAQYLPDATDADMRRWEEQKALEYAVIDGEKRYFNNAAQAGQGGGQHTERQRAGEPVSPARGDRPGLPHRSELC